MGTKIALITGASRGIGAAIALRLASEGWHLVLNCIHSEEKILELKTYIELHYCTSCISFIGDMGDYDTVAALFEQIKLQYGTLDMVVNNAGISYMGLLSDMSIRDWEQIMSVNLTSIYNTSKQAIPMMLSGKSGKIVNISSVWGNVGASCEVAYSTTKGGMNAFTKALAKELAPSNIQVNAIACGVIDTDMNNSLSAEDKDELMEEIPTGRLGTPEEVADLVYQLATGPGYLTGQIITLDGGWL